MEDLHIPATTDTPAICFEYSRHRLDIHGATFPHNALRFYGPLWPGLQTYLQTLPAEGQVEVSFGLRYLSCSSAKLIRALIRMLDQTARGGPSIAVVWRHEADDDMTREIGLDLQDEYPYLKFHSVVGTE